MDRSHNITVKSENGQFYIIRNLTPEVIKPKTEPRSSAPVVLPTPPIFTMARSHDEEKRRRVYTPLMTVPPLFRWEFQWDFCVANWSWALVEPWTTNFSWIVAKFHIFWDVRRVQRLVLISWGFELCLHFVTQERSRWMLQVELQHSSLFNSNARMNYITLQVNSRRTICRGQKVHCLLLLLSSKEKNTLSLLLDSRNEWWKVFRIPRHFTDINSVIHFNALDDCRLTTIHSQFFFLREPKSSQQTTKDRCVFILNSSTPSRSPFNWAELVSMWLTSATEDSLTFTLKSL